MNKNSSISIFFYLISIIVLISCNRGNNEITQIPNGIVPNKETAVKIAEAIWLPRYGKAIYEYEPFDVEIVNDSIWIVQGTLKPDELGGVPYIEIRKSDCKIIDVYHTE